MTDNAILEFLEGIEDSANNELKAQECKNFLSGISELQCLSESDLKNKMKQYLPSIESSDQAIEKLVTTIKNIKNVEAFFTYVGQPELNTLITILSKKYNEELKGETLLRNIGAGTRVFIAIELKRIVERIKKNPDLHLFKDESFVIIEHIHRLGVLQGLLSGTKMIHNVKDRLDIHEMIRSFISERNIKRRWDPLKKLKEEALRMAEKKWENGDPAFHTEMAQYLYDRLKGQSPDLTQNILKNTLKPLAKKYNRLKGMKGVKKLQ